MATNLILTHAETQANHGDVYNTYLDFPSHRQIRAQWFPCAWYKFPCRARFCVAALAVQDAPVRYVRSISSDQTLYSVCVTN